MCVNFSKTCRFVYKKKNKYKFNWLKLYFYLGLIDP